MTDRTHRIAVVGAGPAGFYATGHLLDADQPIEVDLFDRFFHPGLAAGVALHRGAPFFSQNVTTTQLDVSSNAIATAKRTV